MRLPAGKGRLTNLSAPRLGVAPVSSKLKAHYSKLKAQSSKLTAQSSKLKAQSSQLTTPLLDQLRMRFHKVFKFMTTLQEGDFATKRTGGFQIKMTRFE